MAIATTLLQIAGSLVLIFVGILLAPLDDDLPAASQREPSRGPVPAGDGASRRSGDRNEELTARCYAATES